jgi:hypothetical protein
MLMPATFVNHKMGILTRNPKVHYRAHNSPSMNHILKAWIQSTNSHPISLRPILRGPFAKYVDSPYYSGSELCGGAVTVSFSKYLPWQAMHFLQRSTHFSKTCCRPLVTSKFLASELPFHGWKSPEIARGDIEFNSILCSAWKKWIDRTPLEHPPYSLDLAPMRFLGFSNHEKGAPRQEISKWSTVCSTFSRSSWSVVRSASLAKGDTSKRRPSPP